MIQKEWLHRTYLLFAMLIIALCGCLAMQINDGEAVNHVALYYLIAMLFLAPGLFGYLKTRLFRRPPTPIAFLIVLLLWIAFITFLFGLSNIRETVYNSLTALIALCALCTTYDYTGRYGLHKNILRAAIVVQIILLLQYISIYLAANLTDVAHLITSYYPLFLLPLVLMHSSKIVKYVSILVVIVAIFSSVKRGGLLALAIGLIVYVFVNRHIQDRGLKAFVYTLVALGLLSGVFAFIAMSDYGGVIERLMSIGDDGGSGRTDVWAVTWKMIIQSDFFHMLIGHGGDAVLTDSPLQLSAHNDFFEAWYDYGFIGFSLYFLSFVSLTTYTLRVIRKRSPIAPSMAMLIAIMGTLTLISHVLIYYFIVLCCMSIGLLIGHQRYNEHHK